jgi:sec-independent protein translocase protein TatC
MADALPIDQPVNGPSPNPGGPNHPRPSVTPLPPPVAPQAALAAAEDGEGGRMGFMEHLMELRNRLVWSVIAIVSCVLLALVFFQQTNAIMLKPLDDINREYASRPDYAEVLQKVKHSQYNKDMQDFIALLGKERASDPAFKAIVEKMNESRNKDELVELISLDPLESTFAVCWVGLYIGIALAAPLVLTQVWRFVSPGLRNNERSAIQPVLYGSVLFFFAGIAITYFMLFPVTLRFGVWFDLFLNYKPMYRVEKYFSLFLDIAFYAGLACETPMVVFVLARLSILRPDHLTRYWRFCVLGSFIMGTIFSPGMDIASMLAFSFLYLGLYIASVAMVYLAYRKPAAT